MERLTAPEYWEDHDRAAVMDALHCLGRMRQQDSCVKLDELMDAYQPFNPDDSMEFTEPLSWEQKSELREIFLAGVEQLVFRVQLHAHLPARTWTKSSARLRPMASKWRWISTNSSRCCRFSGGCRYEQRSKRDWRWALSAQDELYPAQLRAAVSGADPQARRETDR